MYIYHPRWNLSLRCSVADTGEYKVVAKSSLGEATTYATVVVNCEWSTLLIFWGELIYTLDAILALTQVLYDIYVKWQIALVSFNVVLMSNVLIQSQSSKSHLSAICDTWVHANSLRK